MRELRKHAEGASRRGRKCRYISSLVGATHLVLALALVSPALGQPRWTQTFDLVPGWNAIYLSVQPTVTDPAAVFEGLAVRSVWTRGVEPGSVEFIADPADALQKQRGWLAYVPEGRDESIAPELANIELVSIEGNRGFLIELEGEPATLTVTGRPLVPVINWEANRFNLVGFPIDPNDPPTFDSYFAPSDAHRNQPVYRLLADGTWQRIAAPNAAEMRYGEAYWVFSASGSNFIAPLAVEVPTSSGFNYGASVSDHLLSMTNQSSTAATIGIRELGSPDAVPLSYLKIVTQQGPELGEFQWLDLTGTLQIPATAGAIRSARIAVRRGDFTSEHMASVIAITDGNGSRWLLPLEASTGIGGTAASLSGTGSGSAFTGLWLGGAVINQVSQPQIGSMDPEATSGAGNVCTGGSNEGMRCAAAGDCPGSCSLTCAGGVNAGDPCTAATEASDCPGSTCTRQPRSCGGGINIGLACTSNTDCPGSTCATPGACTGGARIGQSCNTGSDCPGSTCNQGSRCIGGVNADRPCDAPTDCAFRCEESGGGSEFAMRLIIHVDGNGQARLLKQVIQMWQNGTQVPDPNDPGVLIEGTPGRFVLLTNDALIPNFSGASLRDGVPVGKRISTAHFDFPGNDLAMSGDFGGTNTLSAAITLAPGFPTNPYRHKFHPDHDNIGAQGVTAEEAFEISRDIDLVFAATDPSGSNAPDYGFDTLAGTYREEISGLHRTPIRVEGTFRLQRVALTPELNQ